MFHALVHYHEVALKGRNRGFFEQRLVHHLRSALKDIPGLRVDALPGRIRVSFPEEQSQGKIRETLTRTFGITNFLFARSAPVLYTSPDLTALKSAIQQDLPANGFHSFRVLTKRAEKRFPKTSMDIDREIGAYLCDLTGKRVNLTEPDLTIHVELLKQEAYYGFAKESGPGGLPVGTGGTVLCLISGGIDSPVAAYRMIKRGCRAGFIHFHGRPYLSRASEEKVRDLVTLLTRHQLSSKLHLIPFGDIQKQIVLGAPAPIRVVLYRRMMLRIAEALAKREDMWGLVTGDSLGQVASQTPGNIQVVSEVTPLPILRPLIGMDKSEITEQAQAIGSFEISIEPDQDCCTLFVPRHPDTRARLTEVTQVEQRLDITGMVRQGLEQADLAEFTFPD
ncbi:MAG: tRNA 4-thiouridine(8) synthase ThiI [Nitrospirales bacterium]|nr:tRNA 4-thiouridine(8) synthase ThiI [Nitrospira sp.]MDR4502654.1 tRNA 4-thiouridine(8) synthase ThiI [Nitrospirales bacterium]